MRQNKLLFSEVKISIYYYVILNALLMFSVTIKNQHCVYIFVSYGIMMFTRSFSTRMD